MIVLPSALTNDPVAPPALEKSQLPSGQPLIFKELQLISIP